MVNLQQRCMAQEALKDIVRIKELDFEPKAKFEVSTFEKILLPLIENTQVIMAEGAYYGDEGKGKTVDAVLRKGNVKIVARTNSGENAGHTVVYRGNEYVSHLAPSGVLVPGVLNLIGSECVMDPVNFFNKEILPLKRMDIKTNLWVGNVHIVTPYHKLLDLISSPPNASTLQGMAPVHASKVTKKGIRLNDLFNPENLAKKISGDIETYYALMAYKGLTEPEILEQCEKTNAEVKRIPDHVIEFLKAKDKIAYMVKTYQSVVVDNKDFPKMTDVSATLRAALSRGEKILLEGSQGFLLSNGVETHWRSSTSALVHASGVFAAANIPLSYKTLVLNILKVPSSKVGAGINPAGYVPQDYFSTKDIRTLTDLTGVCDDFDTIQKMYFGSIRENGILEPTVYQDKTGPYVISAAMAITSAKKHGEKGATTQKPRMTGLLDCVAHNVVNQVQGPYLSISAVDRYDHYDNVGVAIAYVYHDLEERARISNGITYRNGDIIRPGDQYPVDEVLEYCYPIVKVIPGWKDQPIAAARRGTGDELPQGVQTLLGTIEHFTGAEIISIGNGPEPENLIYIRRQPC